MNKNSENGKQAECRMCAGPPPAEPKPVGFRIRRIPRVTRRPKGYRPKAVGERADLDASERRLGAMRRHLLTCIDQVSGRAAAPAPLSTRRPRRAALNRAANSPRSRSAGPPPPAPGAKGSATDPSMTAASSACKTCPKTPGQNARNERRAPQEQGADCHADRRFEALRPRH